MIYSKLNAKMDKGKFNLSWNTYNQHLKEMLQNMLEASDFTDITLVSDDKMKFKAHKVVLSACSQVFKSIIDDISKESSTVYLRDIQGQDLESILQFMYLGEATLFRERMKEFLDVAKSLEIKEIFNNVYTPEKDSPTFEEDDCFSILSKEEEITAIKEEEEIEEEISSPKLKTKEDSLQNFEIPSISGSYPCNQCDKVLTTSSNRLKHITSIHEGLRHTCNLCNKEFTQSASLKRHIKKFHEGAK